MLGNMSYKSLQNYRIFFSFKETKVTQLCLILCNLMDYNPSDFSVHGILQARILQWVAIHFSRGSSWPRDQTQVSHIAGRFFTIWTTRCHIIHCYNVWHIHRASSTTNVHWSCWFSHIYFQSSIMLFCREPAYCILSAYCILHIECSTFHSIIFQDLE